MVASRRGRDSRGESLMAPARQENQGVVRTEFRQRQSPCTPCRNQRPGPACEEFILILADGDRYVHKVLTRNES